MRRPYINIQDFREVKRDLNNNYLEYKRLNEKQEYPYKQDLLITVKSCLEAKLIRDLTSRRIRFIPPNYNKIRFKPPKYSLYNG